MTKLEFLQRALLLTAVILFFSSSAQAYCFREAGARYNVSPQLLRAIAQVESGINPHAIGYNRDRQGR
ncbi:transglycosylase SLT domain-containing protein, partial [Erwinia amylovora]|uniref:transglycosylase SLT domain-containing protein n=1 Tax=Erwinia amylovora TaxID=552 RepID=UPI0015D474F3